MEVTQMKRETGKFDSKLDISMTYEVDMFDNCRTATFTLKSEKAITKIELLGAMIAYVEDHKHIKEVEDWLGINPDEDPSFQ